MKFTPAPTIPHTLSTFKLKSAGAGFGGGGGGGGSIDWASGEADARPVFIPQDAWHVIWTILAARMGQSATDLMQVVTADTTYFAQIGDPVTDVESIVDFEIQKANAEGPVPVLAADVDVAYPEPGLSLSFG